MSEHDDAQRVLERKALQNVRSLVDKIEAEDRDRLANAGSLAWKVIAAIVLGIALLYPVMRLRDQWIVQGVGASQPTRQMGAAEYVEQSLAKIERVANTKMQSDLAGFAGRVQLTLAIGLNGYTRSIDVTRSSWDAGLDGATTRIVKVAEPFGALPDEVRKSSDVLYVTRTFRIERSNSNRGVLLIERDPRTRAN